jgi:hypothetical protein
VAVGAHYDVVGILDLGLRQNEGGRGSGELHGLDRQFGGRYPFCELFETAGQGLFAGGDDFTDVFQHGTVVARHDRRLRDAEHHDSGGGGAGEQLGGVDHGVADRGKVDRGKDGFHAARVARPGRRGCAGIGRGGANFGAGGGGGA